MSDVAPVKLDKPYPWATLEQFASELKKADPKLAAAVLDKFEEKQSDEFYHGLATGLGIALTILKSHPSRAVVHETVGTTLAYVADLLLRRR